MKVDSVAVSGHLAGVNAPALKAPQCADGARDAELRETFEHFVGEVFFGQLLKAMRKMTDKPAYFHGGRAEEIFQRRLDELMAKKLAASSSERLAEPMYELFALDRK
jgi:Rod binding domain-containing protein